jgi:SAM-dependent methyltransferase
MTGADLVGVDFSRVAVDHAARRAALFVPDGRATFRLGELAATGLDDRFADAVLCVDSFHFAPDPDAAAREVLRILRPGGRYVQTNWQASDPHDPQLPRGYRALDFANVLGRAGFTAIVIEDRPDLAERVTEVYRAALETEAADDDPALRHLQDEARILLTWPDSIRRVLVIAERP